MSAESFSTENTKHLTWTPPFTLDITDLDPDITYRVCNNDTNTCVDTADTSYIFLTSNTKFSVKFLVSACNPVGCSDNSTITVTVTLNKSPHSTGTFLTSQYSSRPMCHNWDTDVSKIVSILRSKLSDCPNTDTSFCYPLLTVQSSVTTLKGQESESERCGSKITATGPHMFNVLGSLDILSGLPHSITPTFCIYVNKKKCCGLKVICIHNLLCTSSAYSVLVTDKTNPLVLSLHQFFPLFTKPLVPHHHPLHYWSFLCHPAVRYQVSVCDNKCDCMEKATMHS